MKFVETLGAVLGLVAFAHGHMEMKSPPPLRSKFNPNTPESLKDYSMTAPLSASGSDFPCKGYLNLLGQPAAKSVASWTPGQTVSFSITGSANHGGGSCQASLSYDQGKTFKVVHSWVGGCPPSGDSTWSFSLPSDTPSGEALFAWTWFNQLGNREMYMNCAVITIKSGKKRAADVAFTSRPNIFVANVGGAGANVCTTEGKDVEFPSPGPDVTRNSSKGTLPPGKGSCTGWGGNYAPPAAAPGEEQPAPSQAPGGVFITKPPTSEAPAPTTAVNEPEPATSPASSPAAATTTPAAPAVPTTPVSSPEPTPEQPAPSSSPASPPSSGDGSGSGATAAGSACKVEGHWNCLANGAQFQRCASGVWSVPISLANGMTCKPGLSEQLAMSKRARTGTIRGRNSHERLHGRRISRS